MVHLRRRQVGCHAGRSPRHRRALSLPHRDAPDSPADTAGQSIGATIRSSAKAAAAFFGKLIREPGFGRLLAFLAFIGCLKVVFNVMDYVLPKFTMQELGPDVKVGRFNAINGILILVLAPVIGVLTRRASSWSMVILGGFLTAASFLFMCLPTSAFAGLANGTGSATATWNSKAPSIHGTS